MSLGKRLKDARKVSGLTQKQLAEKIQAKHNSVSNWENELNMPDPLTIESLCKVLSVSPNYLLRGDTGDVSTNDVFSSNEIMLIKRYRLLDDVARGALDALLGYYHVPSARLSETRKPQKPAANAEVLCEKPQKPAADTETLHIKPQKPAEKAVAQFTEKPKNTHADFEIVEGFISLQSVAAGTGTYLEKDSFDKISVVRNDTTRRVAFYVPVSGDSMEPKYHDGDILMIEDSQPRLGEIGIFTLDGCGFVKIRGTNELISLNPRYDPIPMNDSIACNGKVIGILAPEWIVG